MAARTTRQSKAIKSAAAAASSESATPVAAATTELKKHTFDNCDADVEHHSTLACRVTELMCRTCCNHNQCNSSMVGFAGSNEPTIYETRKLLPNCISGWVAHSKIDCMVGPIGDYASALCVYCCPHEACVADHTRMVDRHVEFNINPPKTPNRRYHHRLHGLDAARVKSSSTSKATTNEPDSFDGLEDAAPLSAITVGTGFTTASDEWKKRFNKAIESTPPRKPAAFESKPTRSATTIAKKTETPEERTERKWQQNGNGGNDVIITCTRLSDGSAIKLWNCKPRYSRMLETAMNKGDYVAMNILGIKRDKHWIAHLPKKVLESIPLMSTSDLETLATFPGIVQYLQPRTKLSKANDGDDSEETGEKKPSEKEWSSGSDSEDTTGNSDDDDDEFDYTARLLQRADKALTRQLRPHKEMLETKEEADDIINAKPSSPVKPSPSSSSAEVAPPVGKRKKVIRDSDNDDDDDDKPPAKKGKKAIAAMRKLKKKAVARKSKPASHKLHNQ